MIRFRVQTHYPLRGPTLAEWIRWCAARLLRGSSVSVSRQYADTRLTGRNLKSVPLRVTARVSFPADKWLKLEIGPARRPAVTLRRLDRLWQRELQVMRHQLGGVGRLRLAWP